MAKVQETRITHEEIEAKIGEFEKKLEVLRVRYEQYFMGIEKVAPAMLRMDVTRIMRDLEQMKIKNTSLKFRLRQGVQKFTSYSTYWNRVMREIEEGTYKKHVDKAKRNMAAKGVDDMDIDTEDSPVLELPEENIESNHAATQAVSDEAEAFLSSIGLGTKRVSSQLPQQTRMNSSIGSGVSGAQPNVVRPAFLQPSASSGAQPAYQAQQPAYQAQQPAYQQPGYPHTQSGYQQPAYQAQQPAYQQPSQSGYQQSVYQAQQPAYQQPGYQPAHSSYQQPQAGYQQAGYQAQQPAYQQSAYQQRQPAYQQPQQPAYQQPQQPAYQQPQQPAYQQSAYQQAGYQPPAQGNVVRPPAVRSSGVQPSVQSAPSAPPKLPPRPGVVRPTAIPGLPNIPGKS
ncbi:MAG: hypothetical protein IJU23_14100 [Proteobacteria bacterium]|nr:hypothetical protein [Pseudomonadota bacterium]